MDQVKQGMRSAWMAGDFGVVARTIAAGAETFVAGLGFTPGTRVLDVACGTGNTAVPLARLGAHVTGVDIAANLLAQARQRAAAEHLNITFDEGDAEQLPYSNGSFDAAISMFGAMFAPRPELVASEFARVLKPGGRLAMANWTPAGFTGQSFRVSSGFGPPSPFAPPTAWGDVVAVQARLAPHFYNIQTKVISLAFDLPYDAAGTIAFFRKYFGPTAVAFSRLDETNQARMQAELESLWREANVSPTPSTRTVVNNEYLEVRATRRP